MTSHRSSSRTTTSSILRNSEALPLWDPKSTLEIWQYDERCIGHARSKGRRCSNPVNSYSLTKAHTILQDISTQQPDPEILRLKLSRLAGHTLCTRYHQDQAREVVEKWAERMEREYPFGVVISTLSSTSRSLSRASRTSHHTTSPTPSNSGPALRTSSSTPRGRASSTSSSAPANSHRTTSSASRSGSSSSSSTAPVPVHTQRETLLETIAAMQEALRTAERRLAELDYASANSATVSRVSTSDISSLDLSQTSIIRSSNPPARVCMRIHVQRRAIDSQCPVCLDDFSDGDEQVWCKDSCGRTMHRTCLEAWRAQCIEDERETTCTMCRAIWAPDCPCED